MTVQGVYAQDVEQWKRDLLAAGWHAERHDVWVDPDGLMYRGPYAAWCAMKRRQIRERNTEGKL